MSVDSWGRPPPKPVSSKPNYPLHVSHVSSRHDRRTLSLTRRILTKHIYATDGVFLILSYTSTRDGLIVCEPDRVMQRSKGKR